MIQKCCINIRGKTIRNIYGPNKLKLLRQSLLGRKREMIKSRDNLTIFVLMNNMLPFSKK